MHENENETIHQAREIKLGSAFVKLANTLTTEYDVVDLLHTLVQECISLLDAQAGGLLIADAIGNLQLVASTSEEANVVEVHQLAAGVGPCVDCFKSGTAVSVGDVDDTGEKWPEFRAAMRQEGFRSIHATPMRLRGEIIGAMALFGTEVGEMSETDAALAQALADVATISILQERNFRETGIVTEQLQRALDSRILIEQAKGVLSHSGSMTMDEAFGALRAYARSHNLSLRAVADQVISRAVHIGPVRHEPTSSARS